MKTTTLAARLKEAHSKKAKLCHKCAMNRRSQDRHLLKERSAKVERGHFYGKKWSPV